MELDEHRLPTTPAPRSLSICESPIAPQFDEAREAAWMDLDFARARFGGTRPKSLSEDRGMRVLLLIIGVAFISWGMNHDGTLSCWIGFAGGLLLGIYGYDEEKAK
jgi:hypothetical protein